MLDVQGLDSGYGPIRALDGVTLDVDRGEVVAVLGANGAGKSTLLQTLVGMVRRTAGSIRLSGRDISLARTEDIVRAGLTLVPEGRHVFARLTVAENLRMGAYARRDQRRVSDDLERLYDRFPVLAERRMQPAGTLSGGEQQQLAISRALMTRPMMLLLDEPSLGLAPVVVDAVFDLVADLRNRDDLTVLVVEQSVSHALDVSDRVYVLSGGRVTNAGSSADMRSLGRDLEASYFGGDIG